MLSGKETQQLPISTEEDDLLTRSSKKIKNAVQGNDGNVLGGHWPKLGEIPSSYNVGGPSFLDKLKGTTNKDEDYEENGVQQERALSDDTMSESSMEAMEQEHDDGGKCKIIENLLRNFPTFSFSSKMKKRLYKAWSKAVIVKLLGRTIGFRALEKRLQTMWAKRGVINLINIGHGYYIVKFTNKEDYCNALTGGPWMIYDHYLTVKPWEANFRPDKAIIDKAAVWVRLPKVPLEYYDKEALTVIGNRIGQTIKVDMNTSCQLRGHFARICVLVELGKQLMNYGHRKETCPQGKQANEERHDSTMESSKTGDEQKPSQSMAEQWRIVQKPRCLRKSKDTQIEQTRMQKGGLRFSVLADVEEVNQEINEIPEVIIKREVVPVLGESRQSMFSRNGKGNERGKKGGSGAKNTKEIKVTMEVVEGALGDVVRQSSKRVEKRMREAPAGTRNKVLMITMGEENEDQQVGTDRCDIKMPEEYGPLKNLEGRMQEESLPHDPGEGRLE